MIESVIMFLLYWLALFSGGYSITTVDGRAVLLMVLFFIGGALLYFHQLAISGLCLPSSLPSSAEVGAIGLFVVLFLGSSLGLGYIVGKFV